MTRAITVARVHFLASSRGDSLPRAGTLLLGVPVQLGNRPRHDLARNAAHHDGTLRVRGIPGSHKIDNNARWLEIMRSTAEHGLLDYQDFKTSERASACTYTPNPEHSIGVINANAYRAFLLTQAATDFSDDRYRKAADRNLHFVLESQNQDGSWHYANDGKRISSTTFTPVL